MNGRAAELLAICQHHLGSHVRHLAEHAGFDHSLVLRASTPAGAVIVKAHRSLERHRQEVNAYHRWTPVLNGHAPQLLAVHDDPPAIIITARPGDPLAEKRLNLGQEQTAYRQAGLLMHQFHNAEPPRFEPDITQILSERCDQWLALAEPLMSSRERADIRAHLDELTRLAPLPAVPCHLDFMPRNILATPTGNVNLIDFEHARYDLAARDVLRLKKRIWPSRPDLEHAFLEGYGRLEEIDRLIIEHTYPLDRLTSAVRAARPEVTSGSVPLTKTSDDDRSR